MKIGTWTPVTATDPSGASLAPDTWQGAAGGDDFSGLLATYDKDGPRAAQDKSSAEAANGRGESNADDVSGGGSGEPVSTTPQDVDPHRPTSIAALLSRAAVSSAGGRSTAVGVGPQPPAPGAPNPASTLDPDSAKSKPSPPQHGGDLGVDDGSASGQPSRDTADTASSTIVGSGRVAPDLMVLLESAVAQTVPPIAASPARLANEGSVAVLSAARTTRDATGTKQPSTALAAAANDGGALTGPEATTITVSHVALTRQIAPQTKLSVSGPGGGPEPTFPSSPPFEKGGNGTSAGSPGSAEPATAGGLADAAVEGGQARATAPIELAPSPATAAVMTNLSNAVLDLAQAEPASTNQVGQPEASIVAPSPARTMTLQLSPANLGTITVRLRVTGSALDVDLSVSDPQTLGLISREHDTLASALRDHDYDLNSLVVQGAPADATPSGDQNAQTTGGRGQAASDHQASFGGNPSRERDRPHASARDQRNDRPPAPDSSPERAGGLLFV